MKVVIVGAGSVGVQLARQLIAENRDVVLIERRPEVAEAAGNMLDCMVVTGEGTSPEVLRRAGAETADFFVAATQSDEVNMIACGVVSAEFQVKAKIARVRSFDYGTSRLSEKRFLGIDLIVNPEVEAARAIMRAVDMGAVSDVMSFEASKMQIRTILVAQNGPLAGVLIRNIGAVLPGQYLVAVVIRENRYIIPSGATELAPNDILYVVASESDFADIFAHLGKGPSELNRVILVGGGRIGTQVATQLMGQERQHNLFTRVARRLTGRSVRMLKIVERDYERCKQLSTQFPDALVINADISDDGVFEDQHFAATDLLIAATDNQELNIVTALYGKSLGVKRSVVLVNRAGYAPIAAQLGIDVSVSQKNAIVASILRFIRSGSVRSLHAISDGRIEAIELTVQPNSSSVGVAIRDLPMPKDSLIVALERDDESLVPGGNNVIRGNDHLVAIARKEHVDRIEEIFST